MQIDGYSLDAQKSRMKAFCEFNEYEIDGEHEAIISVEEWKAAQSSVFVCIIATMAALHEGYIIKKQINKQ